MILENERKPQIEKTTIIIDFVYEGKKYSKRILIPKNLKSLDNEDLPPKNYIRLIKDFFRMIETFILKKIEKDYDGDKENENI